MRRKLESLDEGLSAPSSVDRNDGVGVVGSQCGLRPAWCGRPAPVSGVPWFPAALAVSAKLYGEAVVALPATVVRQ